MAKRFITTEIFDDSWFMDLPNKYKLFWIYLITKCDHAGIWQVNYKLAQFFIGEHLEPVECERILKDRIIKIESGKYWFIPKFIKFQHPQGLNSNKPAIVSVRKKLLELNLIPTVVKLFGNDYLIIDEQLHNDSNMIKDKDKDKVKDKEKNNISHPLQKYIKVNYPRVSKLETQLTVDECEKLEIEFSNVQLIELLDAMENWKDLLKKNTSVNYTLRNWSKRQFRNNGNEKVNNKEITKI